MEPSGDPTRIPRVIEELRLTWEGQPDLPLATFFGVLANRGVGWGTTDEELVEALRQERERHPSDLSRTAEGRAVEPMLVETSEHRVTLTETDVIVRSTTDRDRQPSVWTYESVRATGPGRLLTVRDGEGVEHRLGVVKLLAKLGDAPALEGLGRADVGNAAWLVGLDGARAVVSHRIHLWRVEGRSVKKTTHAWDQVVRCVPGENLVVAPAGGGAEVDFGRVEKVVLLET